MRRQRVLRGALPALLFAAAALFSTTATVRSQAVQHLTTTQPGGMPGLPVMGGIEQLTNGARLHWDGAPGYYQVFQKSNSFSAPWVALGPATNLVRCTVVTQLCSNAFFRVSGPAPKYAGAKVCVTCHSDICQYETNTPHASAFSSPQFAAQGGQTNSACLVCHTVGYGLPSGFVSAAQTPLLAGVQCENCHGPAGNHAAAPDDPTVVPRVELAATVCGGCHTASPTAHTNNSPTFENWNASEHAAVTPDTLQLMGSSTNYIRSCGACHSGSARHALIDGADPAVTLTKDYNVAITCAVCHDPHETNSNPAQMRGSLFSFNNFELTSNDVATVAAFTNKFNASTNINLCAQCHNDRGDAWATTTTNNFIVITNYLTARAPHFSVQYNFLLGAVGELPSGPAMFNPGSHAGLPSAAAYSVSGTFYLTNQCVACHMQPDASPATTHSHAFTAGFNVCLNCHDGQAAQAALTPYLSNQVAGVIFALNQWAALKAPAALRTNGVVSWEYTTPGGLTWRTNSSGYVTSWSLTNQVSFAGPNDAGQLQIPDNIKKARFDLYLVLNDGSFGVHNPSFAIGLLVGAQGFVFQELTK